MTSGTEQRASLRCAAHTSLISGGSTSSANILAPDTTAHLPVESRLPLAKQKAEPSNEARGHSAWPKYFLEDRVSIIRFISVDYQQS